MDQKINQLIEKIINRLGIAEKSLAAAQAQTLLADVDSIIWALVSLNSLNAVFLACPVWQQ